MNNINKTVDILELDSPTWRLSLEDAEKILNNNIVMLFGTNFGTIKIEAPVKKPVIRYATYDYESNNMQGEIK